VKSIQGN